MTVDCRAGGAQLDPVCTGYAIDCSLGANPAEVMRALSAGEAMLQAPPFDLPFEALCGVLAGSLEPNTGCAASDSRQARLAMQLGSQLEQEIRAAVARWGGQRVALVVGTSTGGVLETEALYAGAQLDASALTVEFLERKHGMAAAADLLAAHFGITGPRWVVSSACSSGAKALASARRLIRSSMADAVIAGGFDTLCRLTLRGFHSLGILSPRGCRPFAADRDGIGIGEGGALLCLEREGVGEVRLLGVGESSDAHHMSAPAPDGGGAEAAIVAALRQGRIAAQDVGFINAHGTGTMLNDSAEAAAIHRVFGEDVPVASTKGYMGHLLGAAGAVEAALCVAALEQGWVPASLGCETPDQELPIRIQRQRAPLTKPFVLSNSLAFGGSNASVLWGRSP